MVEVRTLKSGLHLERQVLIAKNVAYFRNHYNILVSKWCDLSGNPKLHSSKRNPKLSKNN